MERVKQWLGPPSSPKRNRPSRDASKFNVRYSPLEGGAADLVWVSANDILQWKGAVFCAHSPGTDRKEAKHAKHVTLHSQHFPGIVQRNAAGKVRNCASPHMFCSEDLVAL